MSGVWPYSPGRRGGVEAAAQAHRAALMRYMAELDVEPEGFLLDLIECTRPLSVIDAELDRLRRKQS
jgi:hypothetical protein